MGEAAVGLAAYEGGYAPRLWAACGLLLLTAHLWAWRQVVWRQTDITRLIRTVQDVHDNPGEST